MPIAQALIAILTVAPSLIQEVTTLYKAVKNSMVSDDQAEVDAALAKAISSDAAATARASAALDDASHR